MATVYEEFNAYIHTFTQGRRRMKMEDEYRCVRVCQQQTASKAERDKAMTELIKYHTVYLSSIALDVLSLGTSNNSNGVASIDIFDFLQTATMKFIEKVGTFELERGLRLTTHYSRDVRTTLQRELIRYGHQMVQGTALMQQVSYKIYKLREARARVLGREVEIPEILQEILDNTGHTEQFIKDTLTFTSMQYDSIDAHDGDIRDNNGITLHAEEPVSDVAQIVLQIVREKLDLNPEDMEQLYAFLYNLTPLPPTLKARLKS